jgi:hypothetical protein
MSTYTFYSAANDGALRSTGPDYASTRAGSILVEYPSAGTDYMFVGQNVSKVHEGFLRFDTNSVPDSYSITSVVLSTYLEDSGYYRTYSLEARAYDWGTTLTTADYVAGANLAALTLLAHYPAASMTAAYTAWYTDIAFTSYINKSGYTRMILCSSHTTTGVEPTGNETVTIRTSEYSGTDMDPRLTVIAVPPSGGHAATHIKSGRGAIW